MSLSSFRVQQDATGQQSSPSTEKGDEHPTPRRRGSMSLSSFRVHQDATGQQSSASTEKFDEHPPPRVAVGCRCHRSACTKTRPDSRVVPRRKKVTNTHRRVRGRMSLSSFRVQQDATGQQSIASTEKGDEHPPRVSAVGCRCHRSACTKMRPDSRVVPRRKKVTNTHRRASAVGIRCHRSACNKTRTDSRVLPRRKK
ncbi:hypothetical protein TNCV_4588031 [Trichonephila clavipes]|uniref:Uncharacterized protein n=1 Tax=Trichonephila clavipes TaxID=2585209 RepID=A0A8X6V3E7_TRICX|nr:hypothetical protein TNCV_4588031 [Trichonephila clavipes]